MVAIIIVLLPIQQTIIKRVNQMQYIQVQFTCVPNGEVMTDILSSGLAEIGFETFVASADGVEAYIPASLFSPEKIDALVADFPLEGTITYQWNELEDKNWNEEWEKNYFQPIVIDDICCIHSSFHQPEGTFSYQILIDPKMAFGTGHHQTTGLILKEILAMDMSHQAVLDMGCGTAVLSILASMKGADPVTAIDIDEWASNNALENIRLNNIGNIRVLKGGAEQLGDESYDIIFANINRNILLHDMPSYTGVLNRGGQLIMSGFYQEDIPAIREKAEEVGLTYCHCSEMDQWVAVSFTKG